MPILTTSATTTYYRFDGGDERPVLMLSHWLGQDHSMWDAQVAALAKEVLLQLAVYAGVPAANTAFHVASEEMQARRHAID